MSIPIPEFISHINESIEKAKTHQSLLHVDALSVKGFSTGTMIRMYNNIVHLPIPDPAYLEVGLYAGKSFCACMNNSSSLNLYGIEDFSQPFHDDTIKEQLEANIAKFKGEAASVTVINSDCFTVDLALIKHKIQVFCFDGNHDYEPQFKALPYFLDAMDDVFLLIIDDFDWVNPKKATYDALASLSDKVKVEKEWILSDRVPDGLLYHNGVGMFLCSKIA